jgi:fructose-1,6-bisphosphatase/inositol monophosphatase family enzyme
MGFGFEPLFGVGCERNGWYDQMAGLTLMVNRNMHRKISSFMNMAAELGGRGGKGGMVHGVRSLGSATLDLAYVAAGAFDIWWEGGCWEW